MKRERLIANSTRPCTVRRTARPRPRGAPRRARPARDRVAVTHVRTWRGTSQPGSGTSAGSAYGGRPPVPLPAARTSAACRALSWRFHRRLHDPPPVARVAPGRQNEKSDNHQQTRSRSDVGWQLTLETRDQRLRLYPRTCTPMSYLTRRDGGWSRRAAGRVRHSRAPL